MKVAFNALGHHFNGAGFSKTRCPLNQKVTVG
jgi:hypothetical protein